MDWDSATVMGIVLLTVAGLSLPAAGYHIDHTVPVGESYDADHGSGDCTPAGEGPNQPGETGDDSACWIEGTGNVIDICNADNWNATGTGGVGNQFGIGGICYGSNHTHDASPNHAVQSVHIDGDDNGDFDPFDDDEGWPTNDDDPIGFAACSPHGDDWTDMWVTRGHEEDDGPNWPNAPTWPETVADGDDPDANRTRERDPGAPWDDRDQIMPISGWYVVDIGTNSGESLFHNSGATNATSGENYRYNEGAACANNDGHFTIFVQGANPNDPAGDTAPREGSYTTDAAGDAPPAQGDDCTRPATAGPWHSNGGPDNDCIVNAGPNHPPF